MLRLPILLLLATLTCAPTAACAEAPDPAAPEALKAGTFDPPRDAPDFKLQGSDGGELTMSQWRGKVVILEFGFTACPDVCPTTLATLSQAQKQLTADGGEGFQLVYLTVDPERDTVEKLQAYLTHFHPSFRGGTGSTEAMEAVRKEYGIASEKTATGFNHSSYTYLIDRAGKLRALMPYGNSADAYAHDVRLLQKQ